MEAVLELALWGVKGLSALGLVVALLGHVAALLGLEASWTVHLSVTLVFIAALPLYLMSRYLPGLRISGRMWRILFQRCPPWMKWLVAGAGAYAILNLVRRATTPETGVLPDLPRGVLPPDLVRDLTAHLMALYAVLYALAHAIGAPSYEGGRRCRNGHPVPDEVYFCEECGVQVPD